MDDIIAWIYYRTCGQRGISYSSLWSNRTMLYIVAHLLQLDTTCQYTITQSYIDFEPCSCTSMLPCSNTPGSANQIINSPSWAEVVVLEQRKHWTHVQDRGFSDKVGILCNKLSLQFIALGLLIYNLVNNSSAHTFVCFVFLLPCSLKSYTITNQEFVTVMRVIQGHSLPYPVKLNQPRACGY